MTVSQNNAQEDPNQGNSKATGSSATSRRGESGAAYPHGQNPSGSKPNALSLFAAFLGVSMIAGVVGAAIAMPAVGGVGAIANSAIESFESYPDDLTEPVLPQRSIIRTADGTRLAYMYDENREIVAKKDIAPIMRDAIIAIEDSRFYEHNGIDVRGTLRALATNQQSGEIQQGGSTITQQYVKLILLNNAKTKEEEKEATERSPERKLREARYSIAIEKLKTKDEILTDYLNIAYFGSGAYGIESAAQTYFNKPASRLKLVEAATLAGVVQQPGAFDPIRNPKDSTTRRNLVLNRMHELGEISNAQLKSATNTSVKSYVDYRPFPNGCTTSDSPYFCNYVLNHIRNDNRFGDSRKKRVAMLEQGGLEIVTTLDSDDQSASQRAVRNYIPIGDASNKAAAISMVQPGTGKILAMAQNTKWGTKKQLGRTTFNYNVRKKDGGTIGMQAGSTFKVFTLAAALEKGISPYTNINAPGTSTFYGFRDCDGYLFPPYTVSNASTSTSGTFNMYSGTKGSVNTFFIGLERMVSLCRQAEIAESMGVKTGDGKPLNRVPSFPLGSIEVVPLDMAGAYAGIANDGVWCKPNPVKRIRSLNERKDIYTFTPECNRVVSSRVADTIVALMQGPMSAGGTAPNAAFGRPAAGKTGTTDNSSAVWFAGYTPQIASAVWVGDPRAPFENPVRDTYINGRYYSVVYGSTLPAPIWKSAMIGAHRDLPVRGFGAEPKYINYKFQENERQTQDSASQNAETPEPAQAPEPTNPNEPESGTLAGNDFLSQLRDFDFGF
jgi:membrane peptidoglycan carboxypeptidase